MVTCPHLCPICRGYWSVIVPSWLAWLSTSSCRESCFYCSAGPCFNPSTCQDGICHICTEQGKTNPKVCEKCYGNKNNKRKSRKWEPGLWGLTFAIGHWRKCVSSALPSGIFPASFTTFFSSALSVLCCIYRNSLPLPPMLPDIGSSLAPSDRQLLLCLLSQRYHFNRAECRCWFSHWEWLRKGILAWLGAREENTLSMYISAVPSPSWAQ